MRVGWMIPKALLRLEVEIKHLFALLTSLPRMRHRRDDADACNPEEVALRIHIQAEELGVVADLVLSGLSRALVAVVQRLHLAVDVRALVSGALVSGARRRHRAPPLPPVR